MSEGLVWKAAEEAAAVIRARCGPLPETAVVLGSGLGDFAGTLGDAVVLPYADLPHWPASRIVGHAGRLVVGTVNGRRVAALAGRVHFYEGHDLPTVVFATRVMGRLGVRQVILTNAAGGINTAFAPGALMVIDDHINLLGNPLLGANDDRASCAHRRRRRRHVDRAGGDRGAAHGPRGARHLVHHQHGGRHPAAAARSRRGDGDREPGAGAVRRAARGDSWTTLS